MAKDFTTPKKTNWWQIKCPAPRAVGTSCIDPSQLLAKAGIDATEHVVAAPLQRLLLEELHHRVKNTLATVMAITSQSLKNATTMEQDGKPLHNG